MVGKLSSFTPAKGKFYSDKQRKKVMAELRKQDYAYGNFNWHGTIKRGKIAIASPEQHRLLHGRDLPHSHKMRVQGKTYYKRHKGGD